MREGDRDSPGITHDLKKVHKFDVLVIDERSDRALSVINKLGFAHHFVVDAIGGGCLWGGCATTKQIQEWLGKDLLHLFLCLTLLMLHYYHRATKLLF